MFLELVVGSFKSYKKGIGLPLKPILLFSSKRKKGTI